MTVFTILSHHQGVQARHRSSKHSDNVNRRNCVSGFPSLPDSWEDRVTGKTVLLGRQRSFSQGLWFTIDHNSSWQLPPRAGARG